MTLGLHARVRRESAFDLIPRRLPKAPGAPDKPSLSGGLNTPGSGSGPGSGSSGSPGMNVGGLRDSPGGTPYQGDGKLNAADLQQIPKDRPPNNGSPRPDKPPEITNTGRDKTEGSPENTENKDADINNGHDDKNSPEEGKERQKSGPPEWEPGGLVSPYIDGIGDESFRGSMREKVRTALEEQQQLVKNFWEAAQAQKKTAEPQITSLISVPGEGTYFGCEPRVRPGSEGTAGKALSEKLWDDADWCPQLKARLIERMEDPESKDSFYEVVRSEDFVVLQAMKSHKQKLGRNKTEQITFPEGTTATMYGRKTTKGRISGSGNLEQPRTKLSCEDDIVRTGCELVRKELGITWQSSNESSKEGEQENEGGNAEQSAVDQSVRERTRDEESNEEQIDEQEPVKERPGLEQFSDEKSTDDGVGLSE